jgi:hypothetical protein
MGFERGDFSFFGDADLEKSLDIAYESMEELQLWDWLKTYMPESFVFNDDATLRSLSDHMFDKGEIHSGTSFALVMWHMQCISKKGWDTYVSYVLSALNN